MLTPLVLAAFLGGAVFIGCMLALQNVAEKAEVRESLRRLEGYQIQDVRDQEMLAPISERLVAPALEALSGLSTRLHAAGLPRGDRAQARAGRATRATSPSTSCRC